MHRRPTTGLVGLAMLFTGAAEASAPAFVYTNNPRAAEYTPTKAYAQNPSGGPITVRRSATGTYNVIFGGLGGAARRGNAQVTGYGSSPSFCQIVRWVPSGEDLDIAVKCFDGRGRPADSAFSLLFTPSSGATMGSAAPPPPPPPPPPRGRTARTTRAGKTPMVGNARGGNLFRDGCPDGQAVIGVDARIAGSLEAVRLRCGQLTLGADGRSVQVSRAGETPLRGRARGRSGKVDCPPNEVVVGFGGRSGQLIDQLRLECAALKIRGRGQAGPERARFVGQVGTSGGRPFPDRSCPPNSVATAADIRAGNSVDAFALTCSRVQFR